MLGNQSDSPPKRKYPFPAVADLSSLCSLSSGYHRGGGGGCSPKCFPSASTSFWEPLLSYSSPVTNGPLSAPVFGYFRLVASSGASRAAAVELCFCRLVISMKPAHYAQRRSLRGHRPPLGIRPLCVRFHKGANGFKGCAPFPAWVNTQAFFLFMTGIRCRRRNCSFPFTPRLMVNSPSYPAAVCVRFQTSSWGENQIRRKRKRQIGGGRRLILVSDCLLSSVTCISLYINVFYVIKFKINIWV